MAKNIVVCCDGTGNEYGPNNTNNSPLSLALAPGDSGYIWEGK
ncbi:MAG: hypothetical protein OXH83_07190 [Bryobacterales bacterium]|nr:hypothetical protein [Bryobacterales bacterium]